MNKSPFTLAGLGLGVALFFGANLLSSMVLRARVDFTDEDLYTLSDGAAAIATKLDEPVNLYYYFSEKVASKFPEYRSYGLRVREMLEEFEREADGNLILEVIEPERFSEEEDRAVEEGLAGAPTPSGDNLYMGLVGTNSTDLREKIPFFQPQKERFLEYDIARLIYALSKPEKDTVGVLSTLPIEGAPGNPMMGQQGQPAWRFLSQIQRFYDTEMLPADLVDPPDVDILMVIHPKDLPESTLYAIDQYVLGGGKLLAFVDPHCESDTSGQDPRNPMASMGQPKGSHMKALFEAWGVQMPDNKVLGDRAKAIGVTTDRASRQATPYVVYMAFDEDNLESGDAVTSQLKTVNLATTGILQHDAEAGTSFTPLLSSTDQSMRIDLSAVQFMPDPNRLLQNFLPELQRQVVAARVTGEVQSAFPDGPPEDAGDFDDPATRPAADESGHLASGQVTAILVADCDFLTDRFWLQSQNLLGLDLGYTKTADNGDFVLNAVENLAGGEDLISIQARGKYQRPFDKVEEIQRKADERFIAEEQQLNDRLQQIQTKLNELAREKAPDEQLFLTPAQQAEYDKAIEEQIAARKRLREVQFDRRKDIEALGRNLKIANIGGFPALIAIGAFLAYLARRGSKRS